MPNRNPIQPIGKSMSVYLDLLRLTAAMAVFVGHARNYAVPWTSWAIGGHAQAAVGTFFVLSGFVIRYATLKAETDWLSYARARAARLYSVVPLCIVVTLVADLIGTHYAPENYIGHSYYNPATNLGDIASYLSFTNELWFMHSVVGSNEPYWSIGFEAAYYMLFGALIFSSGLRRWILFVLWAGIFGPKILIFLPIWLLGVATFDVIYVRKLKVDRWLGMILFLAPVPAYVFLQLAYGGGVPNMYRSDSAAQMMLTFSYFALIGLLTSMNIVGFQSLANQIRFPEPIARTIVWLAGASFTLYLVHQPLVLLAVSLVPHARASHVLGLLICGAVLLVVLATAELGERRKRLFRAVFSGTVRPVAAVHDPI